MSSTLVPEIQKGIVSLLNPFIADSNSPLFDVPFYFDHAPEKGSDGNRTLYPLVVYKVISSPNFYSMNDGVKQPNKYVVARVQLSVFANEAEYVEGSAIMDEVEKAIAWQNFSTTANLMAIYPDNEGISFFERENKIYHFVRDYRIFMGN